MFSNDYASVVRPILLVDTAFLALLLIPQTGLQAFANTSTGSSSSTSAMQDWIAKMHSTPDPSIGCFNATYPSTVWHRAPCAKRDYPVPPVPPIVGGGGTNDFSANAGSSTHIGQASGSFSSVAGITSENDSLNPCNSSKNGQCSNYYSLQVNSNLYAPSTSCPGYSNYNGQTSGYQCWEQFVYHNYPYGGDAEMWYVLANYANNWGSGSCQLINTPPNSAAWYDYQGSCYSYSNNQTSALPSPISDLGDMSISGSSNLMSSGKDQVTTCNSTQNPTCSSASNSDSVLDLYKAWQVAEVNIFGYEGGSEAIFYGSGNTMSISVNDKEYTDSHGAIDPTCDSISYTGETNSMGLVSGSCNVSSNMMSFTEASYYLTMKVNGNGYVNPTSGYRAAWSSVTITGTPNPGCVSFYDWTGSGTGSYSGFNNPATITMKGTITETATFKNVCTPTG